MVKCPCATNSAEQLSHCFFSALLSEALTFCNAKENSVSWKELPGVWCRPPHHWTHWRALWRWTHAVQSPHENTTGSIWRGTLYRQEPLLKAQTANAAEVSFWHDEMQLTTRYTWGASTTMPCHYLCIASFDFVLSFLSDTLCCILAVWLFNGES